MTDTSAPSDSEDIQAEATAQAASTQSTQGQSLVPQPEQPLLPANRERPQPILAGNAIAAIVPTTYEEAYRLARAFVASRMVPDSYSVKSSEPGHLQEVDEVGTLSCVALGIMKGMEIGLPPVTAISTIMIINSRPCLWGDGAVALVQRSGKLEYEKTWSMVIRLRTTHVFQPCARVGAAGRFQ